MTEWRIYTYRPAHGLAEIQERRYPTEEEAEAAADLYTATGWTVSGPEEIATYAGGGTTDTVLLNALMHERLYLFLTDIAQISPADFKNHVAGREAFTETEIYLLTKMLHLSVDEKKAVFYRNNARRQRHDPNFHACGNQRRNGENHNRGGAGTGGTDGRAAGSGG